MGLLDDAIREHLELKRRRGADPGEVAREQHEALDPVERERRALDDPGDAPVRAEEGATTDGVAQVVPDDSAEAPPALDDALDPGIAGETAELDMRTVLGDDPAPVGEPAPPSDDAPADADPLEWEMPASTGAREGVELEDDAPAEDVLEETPDFLRETPEQDRLWFEQRPPRDFDFDN